MADKTQERLIARARLEALSNKPPSTWYEHDIAEFHRIVDELEEAYRTKFSWSRIPGDRMTPKLIAFQRAPRSGRHPAGKHYAKELYCDSSFVQRQIDALKACLADSDSQFLLARNESQSHSTGRAPVGHSGWMGYEDLLLGANAPDDVPAEASDEMATKKSAEDESPLSSGERDGTRSAFQFAGPNDLELRIHPCGNYYLWTLTNRGLSSMSDVWIEIAKPQSFDRAKSGFREPDKDFRVQWRMIPHLVPSVPVGGKLFIAFEGDRLRFGTTNGVGYLNWPSADLSSEHLWWLPLKIGWSQGKWPLELELAWRRGTIMIDLRLRQQEGKPVEEPSRDVAAVNSGKPDYLSSSADKGNLNLLKGADGHLHTTVTFRTAEAYADISDRRRQQLMRDGTLQVVGKGQNRRITVASLIAYCPPIENPK